MRKTHIGEQLHILANLVVILRLGLAEFEVYNVGFVSVGHDAVRATLFDSSVLKSNDATLVK